MQERWQRFTSWLSTQSRTARVALGVSALVIGCGCCSLGYATGSAGTTSNKQATNTPVTQAPQATATPQTPTATAKPKGWQTVQHITGNQNQQTPTYHIPAGSRIVWKVTPATQYGGNFIVEAHFADGSLADIVANAITPPEQSGTYNTHTNADVYLKITASGDTYTIDIQEER